MLPARIILHPTDFSESCGQAFALARSLARDQGARLIVLHVFQVLEPAVSCGMVRVYFEPEGSRETVWRDLRRFQAPDLKELVEHLLAEGEPATEIVRVAKEKHSDLIVMGLHGQTGLEYAIPGSVVERVMSQSPCPVLLVKVPGPTFRGRSAFCRELQAQGEVP